MTLLIGLLAAMLWSCHPSASGRWLRRWMVEWPAAGLSRLRAAHTVFLLLAFAAVMVAYHLFEIEGVRVVGAAVVEAAPWILALDVGAVVELYAVLWVLGAIRQARTKARMIVSLVSRTAHRVWRVCRGRREPGAARSRRGPPKRRDAEPDRAGWLAYA